jgi:hypothetical protein
LARIVATNYREVDDKTKAFVNEVALRIAKYNHDLDSEKMKVCEERASFLMQRVSRRHNRIRRKVRRC